MKYSKYNTILPMNNNYCSVYNALTDRFILFHKSLSEHLNNDKYIEKLKIENALLYSQLLEARIIIDDQYDEIQEIKDIMHKVDYDESKYEITINPTIDCNFNCWYCYEQHVKGSKMSSDTVVRVQRLISNVIAKKPKVHHMHLSFFGGEPLMYYHHVAVPLIEYVSEECSKNGKYLTIHFTSNAYLLNDKMIEFFRKHKVGSFQITLDGVKKDHDKTRYPKEGVGSYEKIVENVNKLAQAGISTVLRINYTAANIKEIYTIVNEFDNLKPEERKRISIDLQRVWQDDKNIDIEDDIYKNILLLRDEKYEVTHRELNYLRNSCYGDKYNQVVVNYNGDIFKCTARDFTTESRNGYLDENGNVIWNETLKQRVASKFLKPICHDCRIAPLCVGGCATKSIEMADHEGCALKLTEKEIDKIILDKFESRFLDKNQ